LSIFRSPFVLHQPHVRRFSDEDAGVEHLDRARQDEPIGEHRALVQAAVAVRVLEHDNLADRIEVRLGRLEIGNETRHLDRPQPALRIPVDGDRILDERLARHELQAVSRRHVKGLQRLFGRQRRRVRRDFLHSAGPRTVRWRALAVKSRRGSGDQECDEAES
jgi:hypothetical protein